MDPRGGRLMVNEDEAARVRAIFELYLELGTLAPTIKEMDARGWTNGDGVWEARLAFGPGYRLYFGRHGKAVILLLLGGDKGSQARDIRRAKKHWADFQEALKHGKA